MKTFTLRIKNGDDLKIVLDNFIKSNCIKASCILTCAGSLQRAAIRFANQSETSILEGKFEIVSLTGTLSIHGLHLHIAIADQNGNLTGGHLMQGNEIFTTAEIVIGLVDNVEFKREFDASTGYKELVVQPL